jgi:hypothetical protein
MEMPAKTLTRLVIGTVVGIGVVSLLLPQPSWAQANRVNPLQDFDPQENSSDPFSGGKEPDSFGIFDLIHRAQLGTNRSSQDFSVEQNESLDAAAAEFRARQRQRIQGQQQTIPANPVTTTQPGN